MDAKFHRADNEGSDQTAQANMCLRLAHMSESSFSDGTHHQNILVYNFDPPTPPQTPFLYSKIGIYRGVH